MARTIELRFPAAGVVRRLGHRDGASLRPPFPAPWAVNVRLEDALTARLRGGSWVGMTAAAAPSPTFAYLVTEAGDPIVTEAGDKIVLGELVSAAAECVYRDRLLRPEGNVIFASRQGDHTDWDYGADVEDSGRAFAFQLSEAGEVGGEPVALIPHQDRYLLGATASSLWVIRGDPAAEGTLRNVSREVGIVAAGAWCKAEDTVYFLSSRGLYAVGASGEGLQAISEETIPQELSGLSDATLAYNHADRGVYIHLPGAAVSWFYDTERKGFWPFSTASSNSHVLIGPLRLGGPNEFGMIETLHGIVAAGSGAVNWRLVTGDTAEEAAENGKAAIDAFEAGGDFAGYVKASGSWVAGRSRVAYPRVRAMWACLWLQSAAPWAYEGATMEITSFGRWR